MANKAVSCIEGEQNPNSFHHFWAMTRFQFSLTIISIVHHWTYFWDSLTHMIGLSGRAGGFERLLDSQLKSGLEKEFPGIVIDENVFDS
jgi:hypothetical protein